MERGSEATFQLGQLLRDARKQAGLTQEQVAERAGISRPRYRDIEQGAAAARATTLINVARAGYGVDADPTSNGPGINVCFALPTTKTERPSPPIRTVMNECPSPRPQHHPIARRVPSKAQGRNTRPHAGRFQRFQPGSSLSSHGKASNLEPFVALRRWRPSQRSEARSATSCRHSSQTCCLRIGSARQWRNTTQER
ncbi:Helix-turn-helix domain-containing protein [Bradyrhizobium sp. Ghvi]|nr:Helix-turn-helix domain-containing protein [Bradyrhizobium sp. Ghvi]